MKNLPDLAGCFAQMKLRDKLEEVSDKSTLGFAVRNALYDGIPLGTIVKEVMEAYDDNPNGTMAIIGEDTMELIKELNSKRK